MKTERIGRVSETRELLEDLEGSYTHLLRFDRWVNALTHHQGQQLISGSDKALRKKLKKALKKVAKKSPKGATIKQMVNELATVVQPTSTANGKPRPHLPWYENKNDEFLEGHHHDYLLAREALQITKVAIDGSGYWEFWGVEIPLSLMGFYLSMRSKLMESGNYDRLRARLEVDTENEVLKMPIMAEYLKVLESCGFAPEQIRTWVDRYIFRPLAKLGEHQDHGLIGSATYDPN